MGLCCSRRRSTRKKIKEVLEEFRETASPHAARILERILREKEMIPDSLIFPEQTETKTSQPRSAIYKEVKRHGSNDNLRTEHVRASDSEDSGDYITQTPHIQANYVDNDEILGLKKEIEAENEHEKQRDHDNHKRELATLQQEKQQDHDRLTDQLIKLQKEKQQDHDRLTDQLVKLQQEKQQDQKKFTEEFSALRQENEDVQMKLNGKLKELQREAADKSSEIKQLQDYQGKLQSTLERRDEQLSSMEKDMNSKTTEIQRKEAGQITRYSELSQQVRKLEDENEKLCYSTETLQLQITNLKSELDEKEKEVRDCCNEIETLSSNLEHLQSNHNNMQEELGRQIETLKQDNKKQGSLIQDLQNDKKLLVDQLGGIEDEMKTVTLTRDQMTLKLETEQQGHHTTRTDLGEQIASLRGDNTGLSSTVEILQRNVSVLEKQLGVKEDDLKTLGLDKAQLTQELITKQRDHHTTRTDLQKQIASLRGDNTVLSSTVAKLKLNVDAAERQRNSVQETLRVANMEKETLEKEITSLRDKKQELHNDMSARLDDLRAANTELASNIDELQQEKETLQNNIGSLQASLRIANKEKETLEKDIASVKAEKQELHNDMSARLDDLRATNTELASNIDELQQEKETLQKQLDSKDDELQTIQREIREAAERAKRKSVVLSIRSEKSGMGKTMVDMVTKEITKRLDGKVDKSVMDLTIQPSKASAGGQAGPLVVLCLNMSRIGTNIQDSLKGVIVNKDVIVLVLHHTSKENLSSLTPTSLRVTGSELRQLGGIIDMAFSSDSGLYECELNNTAIEKLAIILKKY